MVIIVFVGVFIYAANLWYDRQSTHQIVTNQDYIIQEINQSSAQRDENMKTLLLVMNESIQKNKADAAANRQYLEALIENQNITVIVKDEGNQTTGRISGFGMQGPVIVPMP